MKFHKILLEIGSDSKKIFRYIKRYTLVHKLLPFNIDISIVKSSHKNRNYYIPEYNIMASKVFEAEENYEIEIEINNSKVGLKTAYQSYIELVRDLRLTIKYILSGLQQTNFPVSYMEQNTILNDYLKLTKQEVYKEFYKIKSKRFYRTFFIYSSNAKYYFFRCCS